MAADFVTVVSGIPRSGTSLMMQMLHAGGMPVLEDGVRGADENNPRGYFELEAVKKLRMDSSWLERARGRAVKIIHLLLRELPTDGRFSYRIIFVEREMDEILASQRKMLARAGKPAVKDAVLTKVFRAQLAEVKTWIAEQPSFSSLTVSHRSLIEEPAVTSAEVARFLDADLDVKKMTTAVDPTLYRERNRTSGSDS